MTLSPVASDPAEAQLLPLLAEQIKDYAIFLVDPEGRLATWSNGAERLLGYAKSEIIGQTTDCLFTPEDARDGVPARELQEALNTGRHRDDRWHVRKDGSRFWSSGVVTPLWDEGGQLRGFAKIMRDLTEQKRKELALADALAFADSIVQTIREPLLVLDDDLRVQTANRSFYQTFLVTQEETEGRSLYELGSAQWNIPALRRLLDEVLPRDQSFEGFEVEHDFPNLGRRVMRLNARKLYREGNHSQLILLAIEDVTAGRQAEARLRAEEQKRLRQHQLFQIIADRAGEALFLMDAQGRVTLMNPAAERTFGWGLEELTRRPLHEVIHADPAPEPGASGSRSAAGSPGPCQAADCVLGRALTGGQSLSHHEDIFYRKDGTPVRVYCSNAPIRDGAQIIGTVLVVNDVTQQKLAQEQLEVERARLEAVLRQMPAGVVIAEAPSGKLVLCNRQYEEILRRPRPCAGVPLEFNRRAGFHADGRPYTPHEFPLARALFGAEVVIGEEVEYLCGDGVRRVILVSAAPVRNQQGEVVAAVAVFSDLTEQKRARRLLQEQAEALREADRRKDEFLAMLAHELRNPLAPMTTALHIIQRCQPDLPGVQRAVRTIDRQIAQMGRLVEDLLDVSRITRGKIQLQKEDLDLAQVIEQAVETVQHHVTARRHRLHLQCYPLPFRGDAARLHQVVGNLLNNAAKYTPPGGDIWVSLDRAADEGVLTVKDTGVGISREMLGRVFELFVQENRSLRHAGGGLGIGLTLVKSLVEMHGGTVEARSEGLGKGSLFEVRLPLLRPAAEERARPPAAAAPGPRAALLIIDDNEDAADTLAEMLRLEGYETHVAYDGESGLEQIEALAPQVVLLDIGLPGIDGYEVLRRLPEKGRPTVIAVTGYGQRSDRLKTQAAGFDGHLVKPIKPEQLLRLLASLTTEKSVS